MAANVRVIEPLVQKIVFGTFGLAGKEKDAPGIEGTSMTIWLGCDSPASLAKNILTTSFFPAIDCLMGTSSNILDPTISPGIALDFETPILDPKT